MLSLSLEPLPREQQIIDDLGGLDNILKLCLTNEKASQSIDEQHLSSLQHVLLGMCNDNLDLSQANVNPNSTHTTNKNCEVETSLIPSNFMRHRTIVAVNASNNLYFKIFPRPIASILYYDIVLSKFFTIFTVGMYFSFAVIARTYIHLGYYDYGTIAGWICFMFACIYSISWLLMVNIGLLIHVLQTFDFWFLIYNRIILSIAATATSTPLPLGFEIFWKFTTTTQLLSIFLIDTYFLSWRMRVFVTILFEIIWLYWYIWRYFFQSHDAFTWDPFDSEYATINWKFLYLSSLSNIMLFVAKPIVAYYVKKILICWKHKSCKRSVVFTSTRDMWGDHSTSINTATGTPKQSIKQQKRTKISRSFTIKRKRPYLLWQNVE